MSHIKWIKLDTSHSIGSTVSTWQLSFYFWQRWPKFKPKFTSKKFRLFTILMLLIFHWWVTEECGKVVKLCTVLNIVFCLYACNHSVPYWVWLATARLSPFSVIFCVIFKIQDCVLVCILLASEGKCLHILATSFVTISLSLTDSLSQVLELWNLGCFVLNFEYYWVL